MKVKKQEFDKVLKRLLSADPLKRSEIGKHKQRVAKPKHK
jgi:hypothetical protein